MQRTLKNLPNTRTYLAIIFRESAADLRKLTQTQDARGLGSVRCMDTQGRNFYR